MEQCFYLKEHFVMDYMVHHPNSLDTPAMWNEVYAHAHNVSISQHAVTKINYN